jgi:hypothetical protein
MDTGAPFERLSHLCWRFSLGGVRKGGATGQWDLYAIGSAGQPDGGTGTKPSLGSVSVLSLNLTYVKGKRLLAGF